MFLKLTLLNHSKWNNNYYNNFLVEYDTSNSQLFKKATESEILLLVEYSSKIRLRFYYLLEQSEGIETLEASNLDQF